LWRICQDILSSQGAVYVTAKGELKIRPEVEVAKTAADTMNSFAFELGLTPSSRLRMRLPVPESEDDPLEIFFQEQEANR
jgi:P27 family predicted phage terminase small subunit